MSVRTKTLIVICLTFLVLLGILYFTAQWFLLRGASVTEQKSTTQDVTRLLSILDGQIAAMMGFANSNTAKAKKYQCKKALEQVLKDVS